MHAKRFFITGTGTDIGKTVVCAGIAAVAVAAGYKTALIKPVQTGTDDYDADPMTVARLVPGLMSLPPDVAIPFRFRFAASPHLAAAREGQTLQLNEVVDACRRSEQLAAAEITLFEGAGGLIVPLNEHDTMLDLIEELGAPVILAADAGLGGINHAMLSVMALRQRHVSLAGIVLNRYRADDVIHADNLKMIAALSNLPILAAIPPLPSPLTSAAILEAFGGIKENLKL